MTRWRAIAWTGAAAFAAGAAVLLVAASGRVPVSASAGHSAPVAWFLHFTMRRAVQVQAAEIEAPSLDDPALLTAAVPHFDRQCALCHGSPREDGLPTMGGTTPPPPPLRDHVDAWRPRELFWIVRHGIKYTGMPSWPALEREDEVWMLVALLRRLPSMERSAYEGLADAGDGCEGCHGADGGGSTFVPGLSGQSRAYLQASLDAYAEGRRASGIMQAVASRLDAPARTRLADRYAANPRPAPAADCVQPPARWQDTDAPLPLMQRCSDPSPALLRRSRARGGLIVREGIPGQGVPACRHCHGADRHSGHPRLDGLGAAYLAQQLALFRAGVRGGRHASLMRHVAERLDAGQVADVANHYAARDAP